MSIFGRVIARQPNPARLLEKYSKDEPNARSMPERSIFRRETLLRMNSELGIMLDMWKAANTWESKNRCMDCIARYVRQNTNRQVQLCWGQETGYNCGTYRDRLGVCWVVLDRTASDGNNEFMVRTGVLTACFDINRMYGIMDW